MPYAIVFIIFLIFSMILGFNNYIVNLRKEMCDQLQGEMIRNSHCVKKDSILKVW